MAVVKAILWQNGMVMAFDERGMQVPEYQGPGDEVIPKLRKDYPHLHISNMEWNRDRSNVSKI
jgi:hypothetical protein